ncbi:WD domain, G-beta repeat [Plasmodiophora brassicae]
MDGVPFVDELVKEYLLFRGFTDAYEAMSRQVDAEVAPMIEAGPIVKTVKTMCKDGDIQGLLRLWAILETRFFARMPQREFIYATGRQMLRSLQRCMIVDVVNGRERQKLPGLLERIFAENPSELSDRSYGWADWLALPYITHPMAHPRLSPFFTRAWRGATFTALNNFLATVLDTVPLPSLLQLHVERLKTQAQAAEIASLRNENRNLMEKLTGSNVILRHGSMPNLQSGVDDKPDEGDRPSSETLGLSSPESTQPLLRRLLGHSASVTSCRFSNDGDLIASSSLDGTVRVWDDDGASTPVFDMSPCLSVEWDVRSHHILLYGNANGRVKVWNVENKRVLSEMLVGDNDLNNVIALCSSPSDSTFLASCSNPSRTHGKLQLWSTKTGKCIQAFALDPELRPATCTAFNHNGSLCAVGSTDGFVRILDVASTGVIMAWQAHAGTVHTVAFGAGETSVISCASDATVVEWNLHRIAQVVRQIKVDDAHHRDLDFAADEAGKQVCVTRQAKHAAVYEWDTGNVVAEIPNSSRGTLCRVDWSPASRIGAFVSDDHSIEVRTLSMT